MIQRKKKMLNLFYACIEKETISKRYLKSKDKTRCSNANTGGGAGVVESLPAVLLLTDLQ